MHLFFLSFFVSGSPTVIILTYDSTMFRVSPSTLHINNNNNNNSKKESKKLQIDLLLDEFHLSNVSFLSLSFSVLHFSFLFFSIYYHKIDEKQLSTKIY